jgi:hypothetical protein
MEIAALVLLFAHDPFPEKQLSSFVIETLMDTPLSPP